METKDRQSQLIYSQIIKGLNKAQIEAVIYEKGPLLIVAGAGTGKTTVITRRIAYLIASKKAKPSEILALTFTDKAAAEMEERVDLLVPYGYTDVCISTFHSFGDMVLREHALSLGLSPDFRVLTLPEQIIVLKENIFDMPLKYYRPLGDPTQYVASVIKLISRLKDEDIQPKDYIAFAQRLKKQVKENGNNQEMSEYAAQQMELALTYEKYQQIMGNNGMIDFGDQVSLTLKLFRSRGNILKKYQEKFKYILVDEFQDTNHSQFELVKLLCRRKKTVTIDSNLTVVADDDQAIYRFRGAAISNILGFMDVCQKAKQIVLTENYRSTQTILDSAYKLITYNNPERLEIKNDINKKLYSNFGNGEKIEFINCDTISAQADKVADIVSKLVIQGKFNYKDIAVLVRSNKSAEPFLRAFNMKDIPYVFSGREGIYNTDEVQLIIAFMRVITNLTDNMSLFYLSSSSIYKMNVIDLTLCNNYSRRINKSLYWIFSNINTIAELEDVSEQSRKIMEKIICDIKKFADNALLCTTGELLYEFITQTGYIDSLVSNMDSEKERKLKTIAKFFEIIKNHSSVLGRDRVHEFVNYLDLLINAGDDPKIDESDPDINAVNVLTIHKAKGLEFDVVFMVNLVQGKFPLPNRSDKITIPDELQKDIMYKENFHIQEERRLFYVAMTRARKKLYMMSAVDYGGKRARKPSQFVLEALDLQKNNIKITTTSPIESIKQYASIGKNAKAEKKAVIPENKILNLTPHQIDDYITCPLKYKYIHNIKIPILKHHTVMYGNALHKTIQEYHRRKKESIEVSEELLTDMFSSMWVNEGFLSREHEEQRFKTGIETIKRFFKQQEELGIIPFYVEKEFSFRVDNNRINGRWDRVDKIPVCSLCLKDRQLNRKEDIVIIDFKSSDIRTHKEAIRRAKQSLQLCIYALAYQETTGVLPDRVELHFLESGIVGGVELTDKDIEKTKDIIRTVSKGIRTASFEASPGQMVCNWCACNKICPEKSS